MVDLKTTQPPNRPPDNASTKDAAIARKTQPPDRPTVCVTDAATDLTTTQAASSSISSKEERGPTAPTSPVNASTFEEKGSSSGQPLKKKNRTFAEIISDDLRDRNIIEIIFTKIPQMNSDGESVAPKQLSIEDQGEFIFDVLKIDDKSVKGVNLFTNKYDTK